MYLCTVMNLINYLQVSVAILEVQGRFGNGHHKSQLRTTGVDGAEARVREQFV